MKKPLLDRFIGLSRLVLSELNIKVLRVRVCVGDGKDVMICTDGADGSIWLEVGGRLLEASDELLEATISLYFGGEEDE